MTPLPRTSSLCSTALGCSEPGVPAGLAPSLRMVPVPGWWRRGQAVAPSSPLGCLQWSLLQTHRLHYIHLCFKDCQSGCRVGFVCFCFPSGRRGLGWELLHLSAHCSPLQGVLLSTQPGLSFPSPPHQSHCHLCCASTAMAHLGACSHLPCLPLKS